MRKKATIYNWITIRENKQLVHKKRKSKDWVNQRKRKRLKMNQLNKIFWSFSLRINLQKNKLTQLMAPLRKIKRRDFKIKSLKNHLEKKPVKLKT